MAGPTAATGGGSQQGEKKASSRSRRKPKHTRKRPPKQPAHKRTLVCSVRLNNEEHEQLLAAARAAGTTLPAYLARSGLAAARDLETTAATVAGERELVAELFAARRHLGAVGNNLNQITRALNSGAQPELDVILTAVRRAVQRVQDATDHLLDRR